MPRTLKPFVGKFDVRSAKPAPKRADPELLTKEHAAWRSAVFRMAGFRCQALDKGLRCSARAPDTRLYADHIVERKDGGSLYDVANGQCLCAKHHTLKTNLARAARARAPA